MHIKQACVGYGDIHQGEDSTEMIKKTSNGNLNSLVASKHIENILIAFDSLMSKNLTELSSQPSLNLKKFNQFFTFLIGELPLPINSLA